MKLFLLVLAVAFAITLRIAQFVVALFCIILFGYGTVQLVRSFEIPSWFRRHRRAA